MAMSPSKELQKPIASPNGGTLFSCKHAGVNESDISELKATLECAKRIVSYSDLAGGVLVTASWVQRDLREAIRNSGVYLWDQARCHLYGSLARHYATLKIGSDRSSGASCPLKELETIATISLIEKSVGYATMFDYYELGIFHEGDVRFNLDLFRAIFKRLEESDAIPRFSLNRIIVHTTRGFTADFPLRLSQTVQSFVTRTTGFRCVTSDLYDHGNPWFPSYLR